MNKSLNKQEKLKPVIAVLGATASGKTALALSMAKRFPCHLINVDSVQIYRGMDIGSAKLTAAEQKRFPHALMDILDPSEPYSVARFVHDAQQAIAWAHQQQKIPVLVGGSMMYFAQLFEAKEALPASIPERREAIMQRLQAGEALYEALLKLDPASVSNIHPHDFKRLSRLWELYESTGQTPSTLFRAQKSLPLPWQVHAIQIQIERPLLHQRIAQRFQIMMADGFLAEVEALFARPDLNPSLPALQSAGYQQLWRHLAGEYDLKQAVEQGIIATRQLAKRQITWLNNGLSKIMPLHLWRYQDEDWRWLMQQLQPAWRGDNSL